MARNLKHWLFSNNKVLTTYLFLKNKTGWCQYSTHMHTPVFPYIFASLSLALQREDSKHVWDDRTEKDNILIMTNTRGRLKWPQSSMISFSCSVWRTKGGGTIRNIGMLHQEILWFHPSLCSLENWNVMFSNISPTQLEIPRPTILAPPGRFSEIWIIGHQPGSLSHNIWD